jgi:hypothetical protein
MRNSKARGLREVVHFVGACVIWAFVVFLLLWLAGIADRRSLDTVAIEEDHRIRSGQVNMETGGQR